MRPIARKFGTGDHADGHGFENESGAVDLTALRRDDALIEAIRGDGVITTTTAEEYELASLLSSWRDEINSSPIPLGPTSEQAEQALWAAQRSGRSHGGRRPRLLSVVAGAAAVAFMMGGLSFAAHDAQPGDPLWGVNQTLFGDHARSIEAVAQVRSELEEAERLISLGELEQAQVLLSKANETMTDVTETSDLDELASRHDRLQELVDQQPSPIFNPPPSTSTTSSTSAGPSLSLDPATLDPAQSDPGTSAVNPAREVPTLSTVDTRVQSSLPTTSDAPTTTTAVPPTTSTATPTTTTTPPPTATSDAEATDQPTASGGSGEPTSSTSVQPVG